MKNFRKVSLLFILLLALTCPLPLSLAGTVGNSVTNELESQNSQTKQITGVRSPLILAQNTQRRVRRGFFSRFRRDKRSQSSIRRRNRPGFFSRFFRRRSQNRVQRRNRPGFFSRLRSRWRGEVRR